jgi:hypothetical protein
MNTALEEPLNKRYQVFVSSTFRDLVEERQAVMQALLEMDAIPAGMELFPAANDDAWKLIQRIIEQSDYYVLIIGGRYGTTDEAGVGYTEREYDYAMTCGVPVMPFLHENPDLIPAGKSELVEAARAKLATFRSKVEKAHLCKYWKEAEQLGSRVTRGLIYQTKSITRTGWIRADETGSPESLLEISRLRSKIDSLTAELAAVRLQPPSGSEDLQSGEDLVRQPILVMAYSEAAIKILDSSSFASQTEYPLNLMVSWNELFSACGALMLQQQAEEGAIKTSMETRSLELLRNKIPWFKIRRAQRVKFPDSTFQTIKVQLIALGWVQKSEIKRAPSDKGRYWTLTPYGEMVFMQISAIKKSVVERQVSAIEPSAVPP